MKKYLVKELYNEDNYIYYENLIYDLENNFKNDIFIGFNKDFATINFNLINCIENSILYYSDYELEVYYKNNLASYIIDNLKDYKKISLKQALEISKIIKENSVEKKQTICNILTIIFNKLYSYTCMRGYCQGDWIYCIYSSDIDEEFRNYIESVLFNTGVEIFISDEKHEENNIKSINEYEYSGYGEYIINYYDSDKKIKYIASLIGCKENELNYYAIKDVKQVTSYKIIYENI